LIQDPNKYIQICPKCGHISLYKDYIDQFSVCSKCQWHGYIGIDHRIAQLIDIETFVEVDAFLYNADPLQFTDTSGSYKDKTQQLLEKTGRHDAIVTGIGKLNNRLIGIGVLDFKWMGGSMGSVVGEKIKRLFMRCSHADLPVILVTASGGARMQEGLLSLMQMAKTTAAIALHKKYSSQPYISILTNPTMGGVAASFALLGDCNIAEPQATIGFTGKRVIQDTLKEKLPPGFQTAEFCLDRGMIDAIVPRSELKNYVAQTLHFLCRHS
jgi:acetyl-CoA carboxylase carboxyl transferase subunit beta